MKLFENSGVLAFFLIFAACLLVVFILFLLSQQNTLKAIQPRNRTMRPGEVWLQLIPLFNIVWQFVVASRISQSIKNELASTPDFSFEETQTVAEVSSEERPTYQVGMAFCILGLLGAIPFIGGFASIAALICWIIYWVKINQYKNQFQNPSAYGEHLDS